MIPVDSLEVYGKLIGTSNGFKTSNVANAELRIICQYAGRWLRGVSTL